MKCGKPVTNMRPSVRWPDVLTAHMEPCVLKKWHRGDCSYTHPSEYATTVTHLLIVKEDGEWFLDGRDEHSDYTEACWSYDTWAEAMAAVPDFIRALTEDYGVTVAWRKRCNAMCAGGGYAFYCTQWDGHQGHHRGRAIGLARTSDSAVLTSHVITGECTPRCTKDHDHALVRSQES